MTCAIKAHTVAALPLMTRRVAIDERDKFIVSDDPAGVIADALAMATTLENRDRVSAALAPDGDGLSAESVGAIIRITSRDELPPTFDRDPNLDPQTQELWLLFREPDRHNRIPGRWVLTGDELRDLVAQALALRAQTSE